MDDVLDLLQDSSEVMSLYDLQHLSTDVVRLSEISVRWGLAGHIVLAWVVTIPATAFIAALFYGIGRLLF